MLGLLQDAVEEHNAELAALLRERGGGRELRLIVETEDFGVTWRAAKWKLPAFAMCTGGLLGGGHGLMRLGVGHGLFILRCASRLLIRRMPMDRRLSAGPLPHAAFVARLGLADPCLLFAVCSFFTRRQ